jgi:release factor glutamine methyltransferase
VNCRQALTYARQTLENRGIENPSLEGEILVRFVLEFDRGGLFANPDLLMTPVQIENLSGLIERRLSGEPSAYITGYKEFYGLKLKVDPRVLIPRSETELLVEKAIGVYREYHCTTLADIGTGSGCIAISLAKELKEAVIFAIDKSLPALEVAEENAAMHEIRNRINFLHGNLLEPLSVPVDMIIANLPYIKEDEVNGLFEPALALNGGPDGLNILRELIKEVPGKINKRGFLFLEIGQGQADEVKTILHKAFTSGVIQIFNDLAGIERVVSLRLTS